MTAIRPALTVYAFVSLAHVYTCIRTAVFEAGNAKKAGLSRCREPRGEPELNKKKSLCSGRTSFSDWETMLRTLNIVTSDRTCLFIGSGDVADGGHIVIHQMAIQAFSVFSHYCVL